MRYKIAKKYKTRIIRCIEEDIREILKEEDENILTDSRKKAGISDEFGADVTCKEFRTFRDEEIRQESNLLNKLEQCLNYYQTHNKIQRGEKLYPPEKNWL